MYSKKKVRGWVKKMQQRNVKNKKGASLGKIGATLGKNVHKKRCEFREKRCENGEKRCDIGQILGAKSGKNWSWKKVQNWTNKVQVWTLKGAKLGYEKNTSKRCEIGQNSCENRYRPSRLVKRPLITRSLLLNLPRNHCRRMIHIQNPKQFSFTQGKDIQKATRTVLYVFQYATKNKLPPILLSKDFTKHLIR